ncbi:MAG: phosphoglycerate kinase [Proteobacteria bacterium]|nr:phosphoglycerate kinase [Pseudomonadota bacterium]
MNVIKLTDLDVSGKRVFIRADLNVPQDEAGNMKTPASVPRCRRSSTAWKRVRR